MIPPDGACRQAFAFLRGGSSEQIVCGVRRIFFPNSSVWKTRNTQSIPAFSKSRLDKKSSAAHRRRFVQNSLNWMKYVGGRKVGSAKNLSPPTTEKLPGASPRDSCVFQTSTWQKISRRPPRKICPKLPREGKMLVRFPSLGLAKNLPLSAADDLLAIFPMIHYN